MPAVDAYFFGASASTESGLNTKDVKDLKLYQQLFIYFIPIVSNLGFINPIVVFVRLLWFEERLKSIVPAPTHPQERERRPSRSKVDLEQGTNVALERSSTLETNSGKQHEDESTHASTPQTSADEQSDQVNSKSSNDSAHITFAPGVNKPQSESALYVPPPGERDRGHPMVEVDEQSINDDEISVVKATGVDVSSSVKRRRDWDNIGAVSGTTSDTALKRAASSMFVVGPDTPRKSISPSIRRTPTIATNELPSLSAQVTVGRNSQFHNLTTSDRDALGGIEYRSLKLLLKIVVGYFFGLHLFGAICLVGWIQYADPKYRDYLQECGQNPIWWAFYSGQTMVDNLGFTLTPDSMIHFQDAEFPMFLMTFLAFAGNTFYPCMLRLVIWTMHLLAPKGSSTKESLNFLLKYPRRCYTLLFPSRPTWILFGILFIMNSVDTILIIALDLNNPAVNHLPGGKRFLAALFQAASSRHTGTSSFNLADVNPAVQFSLLVMMYIAIYPIAIGIRASNTYEEAALGVYPFEQPLDERDGKSYVMTHIRNQLTFDMWYIFIGIFCVCIAEADKIMDKSDPAFAVFSIFFEVTSAYGNVGLSLGHPSVLTSLSGQFTPFSKLVICATMIRGRHRALPYKLDRAIILPSEAEIIDDRIRSVVSTDREDAL